MLIKDVSFVASYQKISTCPIDTKPEFAFIGRSNVGKSSLINMLCNKKGLAKVSNTPGKTQLINFFNVNDKWHLVDLPGYGYARLSKDKKKSFQSMITNYLQKRENLVCTFLLIDIRHDLQKIDQEFINWLGESEIPFCMVFTKADKLGKNVVKIHVDKINRELLKEWNTLPHQFITSSETKEGREEILSFIKDLIDQENS